MVAVQHRASISINQIGLSIIPNMIVTIIDTDLWLLCIFKITSSRNRFIFIIIVRVLNYRIAGFETCAINVIHTNKHAHISCMTLKFEHRKHILQRLYKLNYGVNILAFKMIRINLFACSGSTMATANGMRAKRMMFAKWDFPAIGCIERKSYIDDVKNELYYRLFGISPRGRCRAQQQQQPSQPNQIIHPYPFVVL